MSFYLCGSRIIVTGWNGADGDIESWKAISQGGQEVQEGERARIVVVLDGVGCRAAQRTVLACYVEELKPVRTPTSGGTGASGCGVAAGSALGTADRKQHELVAGGMRLGAGFWISEFGRFGPAKEYVK